MATNEGIQIRRTYLVRRTYNRNLKKGIPKKKTELGKLVFTPLPPRKKQPKKEYETAKHQFREFPS